MPVFCINMHTICMGAADNCLFVKTKRTSRIFVSDGAF